MDILPAPAAPYADAVDASRLRVLVQQARQIYDWVVLDLPTVFSRTSLMAISECERAFLISTAELPKPAPDAQGFEHAPAAEVSERTLSTS